jgi:6-phosphogluconate dehydrogenase
LIGLGKMGYNLALNLFDHGHTVVAYDLAEAVSRQLAAETGALPVTSLEELCAQWQGERRLIWLMVPAGPPVDGVIAALLPNLAPGDVLVDGGNSNFNDTRRRSLALAEKGVELIDCGTSGGMTGARHGACTMIGGSPEAYAFARPVFDDISLPGGSLYVGASGAGHFVKMVHNGIEYGMMQAMAEGFEVMERSDFGVDFEAVARLWNHGSVIRGWLMELAANAFSKDARLESIRGIMHSSGEGRWTLETALDLGVPTPVIALSLLMRYRSQQDDTFAGKVVAALRNEFGGHAVEKKTD